MTPEERTAWDDYWTRRELGIPVEGDIQGPNPKRVARNWLLIGLFVLAVWGVTK